MENLIQSLLRLERLCADGYAFHFAPADAASIVREQWQSLQAIWPKKARRSQTDKRSVGSFYAVPALWACCKIPVYLPVAM